MVDEIIVNRGILKVPRQYSDTDGLKTDDLYRQAFRYYRMIMKGESPLDIDQSNPRININPRSHDNILPNLCIGCNEPLTEADIELKMPVCATCRTKVKVDYEILRDLFH